MSAYRIGDRYPPSAPHHFGALSQIESEASRRIKVVKMTNNHRANFLSNLNNLNDFVIIRWSLGRRRPIEKSDVTNVNLRNRLLSVLINDGVMDVRDLLISKTQLLKNTDKILKAEKINYGDGYVYNITNVKKFRREVRKYINKKH